MEERSYFILPAVASWQITLIIISCQACYSYVLVHHGCTIQDRRIRLFPAVGVALGKVEQIMAMSLDAAAEVFRAAMRETVKRYSLWYLIQGVLLVAAGALAIIYPIVSSVAVIVLLGWLLIISGVAQGISLLGARHVPHFWLQLVSVILAFLIGFLFLRDPAQGLLTVTLLLIVFFMIEGISKIVFALTIRPFPYWGWVLASGLVGVLLSLVLWASLPVTALWLVGLLLGIELISVGGALARLAWHVRRSPTT
ncbi:uncharacterized membrane protein HdeD (DUF308 family) [Phyllobacterium bourgognense]|uniref:Uncharacterized membrane protein HdeD (DUF308 family) n=2 Tax=Phyllobacterium bourgognense TaxID=314236 RepID=A0A368YYM0_9HYPH|nr:uncharacterized membrane protein HdeD (DUF308 family) [Phyllobacterium bourgognense]